MSSTMEADYSVWCGNYLYYIMLYARKDKATGQEREKHVCEWFTSRQAKRNELLVTVKNFFTWGNGLSDGEVSISDTFIECVLHPASNPIININHNTQFEGYVA
ncbi:CLUMA_CG000702, isoform A [Clunio marinus]|uniref:CLUMA_CG000702, isoform A n=1 Tax=Clunio marinus TaxID=568069 RepID=A0A1J1HFS8_9DIPT|nr:CLUMA_CG000702, isoform A [Clunio marinus]